MLVTFREENPESRSWFECNTVLRLGLGDRSTTPVVRELLVELSVGLRRQSLEVRSTLAELGGRLDDDCEAVSHEEFVNLKRKIFDLDAISEEREAVLGSLQALERISDAGDSDETLGLALANTAATARRLDRFYRRTETLQARIDAAAQDRMNRRLSRLTIISAIFLPLTLIAGIYGMNFEVMPELHHPIAYPLTLAGMIIIALGLFLWFRHRGWMD